MPTNNEEGFATKAIHIGQDPDQWNHGSVVPPLVMSTTFKQDAPAVHKVCNCFFLLYIIELMWKREMEFIAQTNVLNEKDYHKLLLNVYIKL